jgi:hypothetical protein
LDDVHGHLYEGENVKMAPKDRLQQLVSQLENVLKSNSTDRLLRADAVLAEIAELEDPRCVELLIPLFSNAEDEDDLMFSIVHVIEAVNDEEYVDGIVRSLLTLSTRSPEWAKTLHMRILNSPPTAEAYVQRLQQGSEVERQHARNVLRAVAAARSEFGERVALLLSQL